MTDDPNARMDALVRTQGNALQPKDDAYDFIAIGGGTAGLVSTAGLALFGARTAMIERERLGGDCLVAGCVPSKALLHAAKVAHQARQASRWGVDVGEVKVDFARVMHRLRETRAEIAHDDSIDTAAGRGVDVIAGEAKFIGPGAVRVGDATINFKRALIATGGRPHVPDIPGLGEHDPLTTESVFELTERPQRLLVIGGGPAGCELSQAMQRLGCAVTVVQRGDRLLPRNDPDASAVLLEVLRGEGIDVLLEATVERIEDHCAHIVTTDGARTVPFDRILLAAGRVPNVENLGLQAAGVQAEPDGIVVDDRLRTSNRRIYAAGDVVAGMPNSTHAAWAGAEYAALNAFFPAFLAAKRRVIPWATYTDPEVAHVGSTLDQLRARDVQVDTLTVPVAENDRAHIEGQRVGFARVYLKKGTDTILGGTIVGPAAGELIVELAGAMTQGLGLYKLTKTVRPYPTRSEVVRDLAYAYGTGRITPTVARLAQWWIGMRR
ncbi:MAG: FAD-dependent oxidoreductase [Myxococcota bacterium]